MQLHLKSDQSRLSISWNFYCCALSFWGQNLKTSSLAIKIPGNRKFGTNQPTVVSALVTAKKQPLLLGLLTNKRFLQLFKHCSNSRKIAF